MSTLNGLRDDLPLLRSDDRVHSVVYLADELREGGHSSFEDVSNDPDLHL